MSEVVQSAADYFTPPKNYYWRWAEKAEVLEWQNGVTICYRDDLLHILRNLSSNDLPRLGTILLVLAACKDDWRKNTGGLGILQGIKMLVESTGMDLKTGKGEIAPMIQEANRFLDIINELPRELRTGNERLVLLYGISQAITNKIPEKGARLFVHEFASGRLDEQIQDNDRALTREYFEDDLTCLGNALKIFPTRELLELKIRTGISEIPQPIDKIEIAEEKPADLLDELEEDIRTSGLAKLTRRLIAALNIPMHTYGSSDQSYGGVSDITNRGNFDRLLLSELAYDDNTLMARLANNEALYLRREELPTNLEQHRKILIDTTLKMWGIPRVFAISVALACARNNKVHASVDAYTLSGNNFERVELETKQGIIGVLEQLDPSMDCRKSFLSFMNSDPEEGLTECFFITTEESLHSPQMQVALSEAKQSLTYLLTVGRDGRLEFHEFIGKKRKLLSTAKFDLNELFFSPTSRIPKTIFKDAPAFLGCDPAPLFFPSSKLKLSKSHMLHNKSGIIAVTQDHRVIHWTGKNTGGREILSFIDHGRYTFGFEKDHTNAYYILVINDKTELVKLYRFTLPALEVTVFDFTGQIPKPQWAAFSFQFYIQTLGDNDFWFIEPINGSIVGKETKEKFGHTFESLRVKAQHGNFSAAKRMINNGYSTINSVDRVFVNKNEGISLDNRYISLHKHGSIDQIKLLYKKPEPGYAIHAVRKGRLSMEQVGNKGVRFFQYLWTDGSEAWVDSRGLLHLRSSDKTLPEISIVLVINVATTCWASDGVVSGSTYFTGGDKTTNMPEAEFYEKYIQRFINTLR